jgi:hypothetical protein
MKGGNVNKRKKIADADTMPEKPVYIIGLQAATRLMYIALHIPYLKDEKPVGIMMIAQPGMGKSMLLTRFESENIMRFNDLTGWGFEKVLTEMSKLQLGYAVVPDLLRLMARKRGWEAFLTLSNIVLEEGIEALRRYDVNLKLDSPINFGIITAMTTECYRLHRDKFGRTGFGSRFGKFSYSYEASDYVRIEKLVATKSTYTLPKIVIAPPEEQLEDGSVEVSAEMAYSIQRLGKMLGNGKPPHFRSIDFVRRLCKARAFSENRKEVLIDDIKEVYALTPFFVPPYPTATDLEYYLLMSYSHREIEGFGYAISEIETAEERIHKKGIHWDMVVRGAHANKPRRGRLTGDLNLDQLNAKDNESKRTPTRTKNRISDIKSPFA